MTPIYNKWLRDSQRKPHKRRLNDQCGLIEKMASLDGNIAVFDVSNIVDLIEDAENSQDTMMHYIDQFKLPAGGVWIEGLTKDVAIFLTESESDDPDALFIHRIVPSKAAFYPNHPSLSDDARKSVITLASASAVAVGIINTPTIVHTTTRSTPRRLKSVKGSAWASKHVTVKLCIDGRVYDKKGVRALGGARAWHLVRGHYKRYWTKQGAIRKWIEPHFRGDKAVGIITKDYECYTERRT